MKRLQIEDYRLDSQMYLVRVEWFHDHAREYMLHSHYTTDLAQKHHRSAEPTEHNTRAVNSLNYLLDTCG